MNQLQIWFYLKNLHLFKHWLVCGLCDYHKVIVNNRALTLFKCHTRTGYYTEQQKMSGVFLFLVQSNSFVTTPRKMANVSPVRKILWLVFYPSLSEFPTKKYAADIYILCPNFIVFLMGSNSIHKNVFTRIIIKVLLWCIARYVLYCHVF